MQDDEVPDLRSRSKPEWTFHTGSYTQHQLFAILVLRQFLKTDYRGVVQMLRDWSDLRRALELETVPHYSTLCYAERKLLKKKALTGLTPRSTGCLRWKNFCEFATQRP